MENDHTLSSAVENFENWLIQNKYRYNCLFNVSELSDSYIKEALNYADVIVFQTTGLTETANRVYELVVAMPYKEVIIECYINEPNFIIKPKETKHDVYVLNSFDENSDEWELYKLRKNKTIYQS